jgi:hypothetical protein
MLHHHRAAVASDADEVAGGLVGAFLVLLMIGYSARFWLRLGSAQVDPPTHTHASTARHDSLLRINLRRSDYRFDLKLAPV